MDLSPFCECLFFCANHILIPGGLFKSCRFITIMHARLKVPAKNSPALLFLSRGKEEERKTTTISCFYPAEEEQSRGILGGNFQTRVHDGNKAAGLKETTWLIPPFSLVIPRPLLDCWPHFFTIHGIIHRVIVNLRTLKPDNEWLFFSWSPFTSQIERKEERGHRKANEPPSTFGHRIWSVEIILAYCYSQGFDQATLLLPAGSFHF